MILEKLITMVINSPDHYTLYGMKIYMEYNLIILQLVAES